MMNLKNLILVAFASAAIAGQAQTITALEPLFEVTPAEPVERESFGYCVTTLGNSGQFAVSAAASNTVANSRYVNVYSLTDGGEPVLDQVIPAPADNPAFFGYKLAASDDLMVVLASMAKMMYIYRRVDGLFEEVPFAQMQMQTTQVALAMTGNTLIYFDAAVAAKGDEPAKESKLCVVEIDPESATYAQVFQIDGLQVSGIAAKGNLVAVAQSVSGLLMIEKQNGSWALTQTIADAEHGRQAIGEHLCIADDEVILASERQMFSYTKVAEQWILSNVTDVVESDDTKIRYGASVKCNGAFLINGSNYANLPASEPYGLVYTKGTDGRWTKVATFDSHDADGVRDRVISTCIVGNHFVSSFQLRIVNRLKNVGVYNLFEFRAASSTKVKTATNSSLFDVYDLCGVRCASVRSVAEAQHLLPRGIYVVGGQKVVVR